MSNTNNLLADFLPPKNHNNPPTDLELLKEEVLLRHIDVVQEADKYIALATKIPPTFGNDEEANFVSDFIKKVKKCTKALEKSRKEEKEPYLRKGDYVYGIFSEIITKLNLAADRANIPLTGYLNKKAYEEQKAREAEFAALNAEREKALAEVQKMVTQAPQMHTFMEAVDHLNTVSHVAEVAQKAAEAPIAAMAQAQGTISQAALVKTWQGKLVNLETLDLNKLRLFISRGALEDAITRFVKNGGRQCDGVEIKEIVEAKVK